MISAGKLMVAKSPKEISRPTFELPDEQTSTELLDEIRADRLDARPGVRPKA
jgi:hypothetical protein